MLFSLVVCVEQLSHVWEASFLESGCVAFILPHYIATSCLGVGVYSHKKRIFTFNVFAPKSQTQFFPSEFQGLGHEHFTCSLIISVIIL